MISPRQLLVTVVLAVGVLSVSCTEPPLGIGVEGTFEVTDRRSPPHDARPGLQYEPSFRIMGSAGIVTLDGSFWGDGCGDRLEPEFFRNGGELTFRLNFITVVANPSCPAWVVVSDYTAEFATVPPGTYKLRVIHDRRRADKMRRFDAGEVTVR